MRLVPILNLIPPFLSKICINNTLLFLLMKTNENLGLDQVVREDRELSYIKSTIPLIPPFLSTICINNVLLFLLMKTKKNLGLA